MQHLAADPYRVLRLAASTWNLGLYQKALTVLQRPYPSFSRPDEPGSVCRRISRSFFITRYCKAGSVATHPRTGRQQRSSRDSLHPPMQTGRVASRTSRQPMMPTPTIFSGIAFLQRLARYRYRTLGKGETPYSHLQCLMLTGKSLLQLNKHPSVRSRSFGRRRERSVNTNIRGARRGDEPNRTCRIRARCDARTLSSS